MQSEERWVTRSDAWTAEDDERLATLVLEHIRNGSTQLRAFEEASNLLGRTNAACGYRWNGVVRKDYREAIEEAKRDRKSQARAFASGAIESQPDTAAATVASSSQSMKEVMQFLHNYDGQYQRMLAQIGVLQEERDELSLRVQTLENQLRALPNSSLGPMTPEQLVEDSKMLFAIMERARRLLDVATPEV